MRTVTLTVDHGVRARYTPFNPSKKDPHKLKEITGRQLTVYKVEKDCALGEFVKENCEGGRYERGRAFYELTDKTEDVYEGQEIILRKKACVQNVYVTYNNTISLMIL